MDTEDEGEPKPEPPKEVREVGAPGHCYSCTPTRSGARADPWGTPLCDPLMKKSGPRGGPWCTPLCDSLVKCVTVFFCLDPAGAEGGGDDGGGEGGAEG